MQYGNWEFPHDFDINDWFGFIYRIIEKDTGREYIGKKQFHSTTRKIIKNRKNRKTIIKESKWKTYTSSSTHINNAITEKGIENFGFYIESLHKTKASLYYAEVERQVIEDVLRTRLEDGITPKYFNRQIGAVKFVPPVVTPEEKIFTRSNFYINKKNGE